ncbi:MAG: filamentous hemagglutinin N-terminal domain-containing protein, partial [Proteobacteria bacterium]|nr:filamentous hemagglutinin N-terminal domain-containing protein [Pseudomonadota bacterium]
MLIGTALGLALAGAAQAQTVISPEVGARGLGTTATTAGNVTTIGGGTLAGGNLFQSFSAFSLGAGDVARWTLSSGDPASVHNVVNRVTGGQPSQIGGTIDSTGLPNAAFFFLNPAGVIFGAGAQVNVPSAAYFSTAAELRFADGSKFAMATPGGSTLSIAAPQSFGFVGGQGAVTVNGVTAAFAPATATLSLSGANVSATGSTVQVRGLDLVAVGAGAADVPLANPLGTTLGGAVSVQGSQLVVSSAGGGGGALRLGGGAITLDGANVISDTQSAVAGAPLTVAATGTLTLRNTTLGAETRGPAAGGDVTLTAQTINGDGGSAFVLNQAAGPSGRLSLTADSITLSDAFTASSNSIGAGAGGSIQVTARTALSMNGAFAVASALAAGRGGDVTLTAPTMQLTNALATTAGNSTGKPGNVLLSGGTITASGGLLGSAPGAATDTGALDIEATNSFTGTNGVSMTAATFSAGAAGTITIAAPKITLQGAFLETDSFGVGGTGTVSLQGG